MARRIPNRAFTLIELLVVVAIIGLLISIILPGLGRAKENARRAVCLSNLRHLGQAFQQYLHKYNDNLPFAAMQPSVDGGDPNWEFNHPPITTFLEPYARNLELFRCPADTPGRTQRTDPDKMDKSFWETDGTSYQYNPWVSGVADVLAGDGKSGVFNVGDTVVKIKPEPTGHPWHHLPGMKTSELYLLTEFESFHGKRGTARIRNTLYADLHVEEYLLEDPNRF